MPKLTIKYKLIILILILFVPLTVFAVYHYYEMRSEVSRHEKFGHASAAGPSHAEFHAAAEKEHWQYLVMFFLIDATALAGSALLGKRIAGDITVLIDGLREIERGNLSFVLNLRNNEELRELSRTFNRMAAARQQAERKVKESEQFLTSVLNGIGEGVVVIGRDFKIISANKGYCSQVKISCGDIIGRHCYEVSHHIDRPCFQNDNGCECTVKRCFDTGEHHRSIHEHYDSEGKRIHVETNAYPLRDPSGKVTAAIETLTDVTQRVEMEKQLEDAKEHYRKLYNDAPDMMHSIDREGIIRVCNETEAKVLGYDPGELIGLPASRIITAETQHAFTGKLNVLMETGVFEGELTYLAKDGRKIPVFVKAKAVYDQAGVFLISDEVSRDITEKKSLEAQLLHAQKLEAIGTLAGGVAHDFNNILTAIMGFGNLLKVKIKEDLPKTYVTEILAASQRAVQLTRSLLAFGRKQTMSQVPIDLNEVVGRVEKLLTRVIGENIEFNTVPGEQNLTVMADPAQIEQVLINLATNARDAMPSGGRFIIETDSVAFDREYVRSHGYGKEGNYARITAYDNGTGMDDTTQVRIFDPFFTTKEAGKGTGLGLAIVYGIVKQHSGYINCHSEPGKGTAFKIYLPLLNEKAERAEPVEQASFPRGSETVLIAEDNAPTRAFIEALLKEYGYSIITAVDGEDAIRKFSGSADRVHLAILDVVMPKKNGKDVYKEIRKIKSDVKTLFMSGYTADVIVEKDIIDEGLNFISKPVAPGELLKKMRALLDC